MGANGVPGIDHEVHDRRLELPAVRPDDGQVATVLRHQSNILRQDPPKQHLELRDQFAEVEALSLDRLLA